MKAPVHEHDEQLSRLQEETATLRTLLEVQESIALSQAKKLETLIAEQAQADAERLRLKDEIIRMQEELLAELSTPLILLGDGIVLMPLVGAIDERRANRMMDMLLSGVQSHRAHTAILDITGVPFLDLRAASILVNAAAAARLLGTRPVFSGIRPEVARQLIDLGFDVGQWKVFANLRAAMGWAERP